MIFKRKRKHKRETVFSRVM